jgi:mono/diheme cytochrome c family protein
MRRAFRRGIVAGWGIVASISLAQESAPKIDYQKTIRAILSDNCYHCHGPDEGTREGGLRLDQPEGALAPRDSGPAIVPGKPSESLLYRRIISSDPDEVMPPPDSGRTLSEPQKDLLRQWIEQGAEWKDHWAFLPPKAGPTPTVGSSGALANPIDGFVAARLEPAGLGLAEEAPPETLARRLSLDLIGLPPEVSEVDRLLAEKSPDRIDRFIDRLLASPRYGEHWGAGWLDAARYADTNGYQNDGTRTQWPWRDWVISSLNQNLPIDEFIVLQMAGDRRPDASLEDRIATGFHRNHPLNGEGGRIPEESRVEYAVDRVDTTATVFLGITLACARCHDHKYDPLTRRDYYRLFAFFNSIDEVGGVDRGGNAAPTVKLPTLEQAARAEEIRRELAALEARLAEPAPSEPPATAPKDLASMVQSLLKKWNDERPGLQRRADQLRSDLTQLENQMVETMVLAERAEPRKTYKLERGLYDKPDLSEELTPGVPAALDRGMPSGPADRWTLARWLVSPEQPLTARVTVNRWWQQLFGTGIVRTVEDFGSQGELPSHPELIDWLAVELQGLQWDAKRFLRLVVSSRAYQQSSVATPERLEKDPENRLLSRGPRYRLSSLALRDQALFVAGLLVDTVGGPGVNPYQPANVWTDFSLGKIQYEQGKGRDLYRRSVYTFWRRSVGPTMFFDASTRQVCEVRRRLTNTPLHALTLLNDTTFVEAARVLAERTLSEGGSEPIARLDWAFRSVTCRRPSDAERALLLARLESARRYFVEQPDRATALLRVGDWPASTRFAPAELASYAVVMNVLLNLDETVCKE